MNVLIVGNGGREHALAWKAAQSPEVEQVFVAPGNAGTLLEPKVKNINIEVTDIKSLLTFAKQQEIHLTIIGPEAALAVGVVDAFQKEGLACFGPSQAAAQLEASKAFSKDFMIKNNIPTARYACFENAVDAKDYINQQTLPIVIKADGLAAGKGVIIAHTKDEANAAIDSLLLLKANQKIIIEEFLKGEEVSFIVMTDGKHILPLATSQDHKTRDNNDQGPNTGGMGAYSPAPLITPELHEQIINSIFKPTLASLAAAGIPYLGFLYAGLMLTPDGPKVLEFNCRLGDPETQPILMRLQSDLVKLCLQAINGRLDQAQISWDPRIAIGIVLAAQGYPFSYPKGDVITGLDHNTDKNCKIFHAGTTMRDNQIITCGGRVLCVTTLGNTYQQAQTKAYEAVKHIKWQHQYYRTDIGAKALRYLAQKST